MDFDFNSLSISPVDLTILAVLLISATLAFFRGAVREVLSIAGWATAAAAAYYGFEYVKPYIAPYIEIPLVVDALAAVGIFIAALVVISLVNGAIARRIKTSRLGSLDRSLGFLFGLARGALVICLAYLMMVVLVPPDEQPDFSARARALPLVEIGAVWLVEAAPSDKRDDWLEAIASARKFAGTAWETKDALDILMNPPPVTSPPDRPGYSSAERKELDRLIGTTQ